MMHRDVSLKQLNTFGIDVCAAQYGVFADVQQLKDCLQQSEYAPWILGGGSNILLADDLLRTVLKNAISGIEVIDEREDEVIIRVGAGVVWHELVTWAVSQDFGGLENLSLIPGTVGAAPIQNIGAYGRELTETFVSLNAVRLQDSELRMFSADECEFGYRDSVFKGRLKEQHCIVSIDLRLTKPPHEIEMSYGVIHDVIEKRNIHNPGIRDVYDAVIEIRRSKLPDPLEYGNAGSFFKNPTIGLAKYEALHTEHPGMPAFLTEEHQYKIPAGWLIEQCGWKGKRIGNVGCFEKQALVIVNYGGASGREVYDHAMRVRDSVVERFGIELSPEVNVIL